MNPKLLTPEIQTFINDHLNDDPTRLLLKYKEFQGVSMTEIIEQIASKKSCEKKLPTWFQTANIYYPNKLNIEQTSSEVTANYKASLLSGNHIIDVTGGFGVDSYSFAKQFKKVTHCELSETLSQIAAHNFTKLDVTNVKTVFGNGIAYFSAHKDEFDTLYIDPSRRNDIKGKVFLLEDCLPNVVEAQSQFFDFADKILIKTSPLLDITNGLRVLQNVHEIHVVAVKNEVKELLWLLDKKNDQEKIRIVTVNLLSSYTQEFSFTLSEETDATPEFSDPEQYIYEPNSAIMKAGGFNSIAKRFDLKKLHPHSHLYTSEELVTFPGRTFTLERILPYQKRLLKKELKLKKANLTTRNFPESVATIRKKISLQDGGTDYLFATTLKSDEKVILHCKKVIS